MISLGQTLAVEREAEEAGSLNSHVVFATLAGRQRCFPADGKRLDAGNLGWQRRGRDVDDRFDARDERRHFSLRGRRIQFGVNGRGPWLAVRSQHSGRHQRDVLAEKLRARHIVDCRSGKLGAQAFENGDGVRGNAVVVAQQHIDLIGQRTDDGDFDSRLAQRQHAVVFQQHHGLIGDFAGQGAMPGAIQ